MIPRRDFLKSSGLLVASVAALSIEGVEGFLNQAGAQGAGYPDPDFLQLDSWIVIRPDNTATFFVGKTDLGQGTGTAFRQIMSDELDIAYENTTCVMGTTNLTVDQGGSGGSDALQTDGYPMRRVAAEARRVLLDMAATHFSVPVSALAVSDGVVSLRAGEGTPGRSITYGELIGGKRFNVTLTGKNTDTTTGDGEAEAGAGAEERRQVATAIRRPGEGGRIAEMGRGREAARHGARAQRAAAGRRRHARER